MKMRHFALGSGLVAMVMAGSIPAIAQTTEDRAAARAAADAGAEAFEAGKWEEAADLFQRAERLLHAPPHVLFGARSLVKLGRLVEARELYLALSREKLPPSAPKAFRDAVSAGERELDELEPRIGHVSVVVQGSSSKEVQVTRDGKPMHSELLGVPHPVDPGKHEYQALAEGMESAVTSVQVKEGGRETVVLTLYPVAGQAPPAGSSPPAPQPTSSSGVDATFDTAGSPGSGMSGMKIGAFVGFGVAAVGTGLGTYFLIAAGNDRDEADKLFEECKRQPRPDGGLGCTEDSEQGTAVKEADDKVASKEALAVTSYVVGGVGLVTGVTLLLLDSGSGTDEAKSTVRPVIGFRYAGLSGNF